MCASTPMSLLEPSPTELSHRSLTIFMMQVPRMRPASNTLLLSIRCKNSPRNVAINTRDTILDQQLPKHVIAGQELRQTSTRVAKMRRIGS
jgi:hypothetical protein